MILYSIVPVEIVFQNMNTNEGFEKEISYRGEKVMVTSTENNHYKITRVISTSPQAFLDPKLQPGVILENI
jgi:hypothetical protein